MSCVRAARRGGVVQHRVRASRHGQHTVIIDKVYEVRTIGPDGELLEIIHTDDLRSALSWYKIFIADLNRPKDGGRKDG